MDDIGTVGVLEALQDLVEKVLDVVLQQLHGQKQNVAEVPVHELLEAVEPGKGVLGEVDIYKRYNLRLVGRWRKESVSYLAASSQVAHEAKLSDGSANQDRVLEDLGHLLCSEVHVTVLLGVYHQNHGAVRAGAKFLDDFVTPRNMELMLCVCREFDHGRVVWVCGELRMVAKRLQTVL